MLRVLIADDEALLAISLQAQLEQRGFQVVGSARNGQEAVELSRALRPDAILMDVRMPIMGGVEATRRIMAEGATPIVLLTALAESDACALVGETGAKAYLTKPASIDDVVQALRAACQADP